MNFSYELVPVEFGRGGSLYSFKIENQGLSEYMRFLTYHQAHPERNRLYSKIKRMVSSSGFRGQFFKSEARRGVVAPVKRVRASGNLRLYCLRMNEHFLIVGGGGIKPEGIATYQEVPELDTAVNVLEDVYRGYEERRQEGGITIVEKQSRLEFEGELYFERE